MLSGADLLRVWIGEHRRNFCVFLSRVHEDISQVTKRVPCKQAPESHERQRERKHSLELGILHLSNSFERLDNDLDAIEVLRLNLFFRDADM